MLKNEQIYADLFRLIEIMFVIIVEVEMTVKVLIPTAMIMVTDYSVVFLS